MQFQLSLNTLRPLDFQVTFFRKKSALFIKPPLQKKLPLHSTFRLTEAVGLKYVKNMLTIPCFLSVFTFDAADVISLTRMNASNLTMEESGFCQETSSLMDASGHQDKSCNIGQINDFFALMQHCDSLDVEHLLTCSAFGSEKEETQHSLV